MLKRSIGQWGTYEEPQALKRMRLEDTFKSMKVGQIASEKSDALKYRWRGEAAPEARPPVDPAFLEHEAQRQRDECTDIMLHSVPPMLAPRVPVAKVAVANNQLFVLPDGMQQMAGQPGFVDRVVPHQDMAIVLYEPDRKHTWNQTVSDFGSGPVETDSSSVLGAPEVAQESG